MTVYERIKYLSNKRGKSLNEVEEDLGLSKNVLYRMKNSDNPTKDRIEVLADYFNVSTDYLLGRTDNPDVNNQEPVSQARRIMMRMDTDGLTEKELDEVEKEMERYLKWRIDEIAREKGMKD